MLISAIIPTHNPNPERLARTLDALSRQSAVADSWEVIVVDNASTAPPQLPAESVTRPKLRLIQEPKLGLTHARLTGVTASRGEFIVFVDDDNALAPDYLEKTVDAFRRLPTVGALGGKSVPEFSTEPPEWKREFFSLLALRDLGERELVSKALGSGESTTLQYPPFAPIGAGMALRRVAVERWLSQAQTAISDRRGSELSSGGDNDIVLTVLRSNWAVAYIPTLRLTHLIPASRLEQGYLERLNHDIQKSWMKVLSLHNANPWAQIPPWSVGLRKTKAWFSYRAWQSPAARIRWRGACGHFEGRAEGNT